MVHVVPREYDTEGMVGRSTDPGDGADRRGGAGPAASRPPVSTPDRKGTAVSWRRPRP